MERQTSTETIIMAAISTASPPHLSHSISSYRCRNQRRLLLLLSSPALFSLTLRHLQSLSLHQKSLLIGHHLFSNLSILNDHLIKSPSHSFSGMLIMRLREVDAALLLLLLCELHRHHRQELIETPPSQWRLMLCRYVSHTVLNLSFGFGGGFSTFDVLNEYVATVTSCRKFASALGSCGGEVAASAAAVVGLPSVEVSGGGECVICREEMKEGREVCMFPCGHYFHWMCILRWLRRRNTCPCCRHQLPSDDVLREIDRVFDYLTKIGIGGCT